MDRHDDVAGDPGPVATRDALADSIARQIERRAAGRVQGLRVACSDGRVVLQGRCRTYHAKQLAQEAALDLLGGDPLIVNQIVVG